MLAYLRGVLDTLTPTQTYIDCQGIGYAVHISLTTYGQLQREPLGEVVRLWITEVIREEQHELYGFATQEEQSLFVKLISVSGVGPSTARIILSSYTPGELAEIIEQSKVERLKEVKGIGLKTAQRIIVDLQGKLSIEISPAAGSTAPCKEQQQVVAEEAFAALKLLGFADANIKKVLKEILRDQADAPVETIIKLALSRL